MAENGNPVMIFNHDIIFLYDLIQRFIEEVTHSQSSGVAAMLAHDQDRLKSYIKSMRTAHAWIIAQPLLDLPETHPKQFPLEAPTLVINQESESANQVVRLLDALRNELINSQSARLPSTLLPADSKRFVMIVDKIEKFLSDYITQAEPLDLPESSPSAPMVTDGKRGV